MRYHVIRLPKDVITHQCHNSNRLAKPPLTHWGRVTHICVVNLIIIGSDNGLSPDRRQAIIWTNAGILLIGTLGTNFSEILIEIHTFSFKKMRLKVSSAKWRPFCLGLNVLEHGWVDTCHNFVWMWSHIHAQSPYWFSSPQVKDIPGKYEFSKHYVTVGERTVAL